MEKDGCVDIVCRVIDVGLVQVASLGNVAKRKRFGVGTARNGFKYYSEWEENDSRGDVVVRRSLLGLRAERFKSRSINLEAMLQVSDRICST